MMETDPYGLAELHAAVTEDDLSSAIGRVIRRLYAALELRGIGAHAEAEKTLEEAVVRFHAMGDAAAAKVSNRPGSVLP